ncbi:MAG: hypothetical protein JOY96_08290 [Verrucomicrobia bacterium]|nr:hypothetical protein [Verrucomicrobiota bacterium]
MWSGLSLCSHLEFRFGQTSNLDGGTLSSSNSALLFQKSNGEFFDLSSSLYVQQVFATDLSCRSEILTPLIFERPSVVVTGWLRITADVQVIDPFAEPAETATFLGVRED